MKLATNQLKDIFVRFKDLADRKKEVFDDDLIALMTLDEADDYLQLVSMKVTCGTGGQAESTVELEVNGKDVIATEHGDGPVDATFKAIRAIYPNTARLQLYQVHAVTEGTDAQSHGFGQAGRRWHDCHGSVGEHGYRRGLGQSLYPRAEPPDRAPGKDRPGRGCPRNQLQRPDLIQIMAR